jgi:hypothetical protein
MKAWRLGLAAVLVALTLTGCGALALLPYLHYLDDFTGGGDDSSATTLERALSYRWDVESYSGSEVGAVTVSNAAAMEWDFDSDGRFTLTSALPLPQGSGASWRYDEAGTWRVTDAGNRRLALKLTRHSGTALSPAQQVEISATGVVDETQLALVTEAVGPGSVRYVLSR